MGELIKYLSIAVLSLTYINIYRIVISNLKFLISIFKMKYTFKTKPTCLVEIDEVNLNKTFLL